MTAQPPPDSVTPDKVITLRGPFVRNDSDTGWIVRQETSGKLLIFVWDQFVKSVEEAS